MDSLLRFCARWVLLPHQWFGAWMEWCHYLPNQITGHAKMRIDRAAGNRVRLVWETWDRIRLLGRTEDILRKQRTTFFGHLRHCLSYDKAEAVRSFSSSDRCGPLCGPLRAAGRPAVLGPAPRAAGLASFPPDLRRHM
jgi:hypothetical protein